MYRFDDFLVEPEHDYFVDGLQDILITELTQIRRLRVTSRQSTTRYRDSRLPTIDIAQRKRFVSIRRRPTRCTATPTA